MESTHKNPTKPVQQCLLCQYDISGQQANYIPQYHLMALRCPECGQQQPAGIIAQPWKYRRLKSVFMRLCWLVLLSACVIGGISGLVGMSQSTAYASSHPFAHEISKAFSNADESYHIVDRGNGFIVEYDIGYQMNMSWWDEVGRNQLLSSRRYFDNINTIVLTDWLWFLLIAPIVAVLYRVLFSQSGAIPQVVVCVSSLLLAAFLTWAAVVLPAQFLYLGYYVPNDVLATSTAGLPIAWMTFFIGTASYILAFFAAGPILQIMRRAVPMMPNMTIRELKSKDDC